ncbi:hypothetical protein ACLQ2N_16275 [Streptomyces sp. DT224]|uniref:hypothetical protein n=1 Tax=Streptomyces sp. DT224 TaxID=3393426 RepID=UPI003CF9882C
MNLRLATCSYVEFRPGMGIPVRSTVGATRWPLPYQLAGHARLVTPTRDMLKIQSRDAYEFSYRRMLNGNGIDAIRRELLGIAAMADADDAPLVLLCFDQLGKLPPPNNWCHRLMVATWWTEQTGEDVPELGATGAPTPPPTLFDF